jgi:hypothetical protein
MTDQRLRLAVQMHGRHIGQLKECESEIGEVMVNGGANQDVRGRRQLQEVQSSRLALFGCTSTRGIQ